MSGGVYSQTFNSLNNSGSINAWVENSTLPGWYASQSVNALTVTNYQASTGSSTAASLYSYGAASSTERALGSLAGSSGIGDFAYGVRFTNDMVLPQTNFLVSYTGEQWRAANKTNTEQLAFSYRISSTPIINSDAASNSTWKAVTELNFTSPNTNGPGALNGNAVTNRQAFTNVLLSGVIVQPGQEIFLRWFDTDDSGSDDGMGIDDLTVSFQAYSNTPAIITQPQNQAVTEGINVSLTVAATGTPPPHYQWQCHGTNLPGETNTTLTFTSVTTNQAGVYAVVVTNLAGSTNSFPATLLVNTQRTPAFSVLTYNVHGNFATNWTTNSAQVQAIGRQLAYLNPDIITFQEIPLELTYEMTNFVTAFLPGYNLATNSGTDGYIRSVIASRYQITRSTKWLDAASLTNFGYDGRYTRDLFEAVISVPGVALPVHVFTTHLKSGQAADDTAKRAAESAAISNLFVTGFLTTNASHPYLLTGDLNEDINRPPSGTPRVILNFTNAAVGLRLTTPLEPVTGSNMTFDIQNTNGLEKRYDYIFPGSLLFSNISSSRIFQTDVLTNLPPTVLTNDDKTASDHLPVLMVFGDPGLSLPSITSQPQDQAVTEGTPAGFSVTASGTSPLSYQWRQDAVNLSGATNATLTVSNVQTADVDTYAVVVSNALGAVISTNVTLAINNYPPVAGDDTFRRAANRSLKIAIPDLLTNDSDPDHDLVAVTGIGLVSTNGVPLATNSAFVFYTNNLNVADRFSYTISDGHGGSATGVVSITISIAAGTNNFAGFTLLGTGSNQIVLAGVPGYQYVLQWASNLTTSPWFDLSTNTVGTNGLWSVTDVNITNGTRFYRSVVP
jgi:endonuclease/exonuclease/phosphatase family metal-dependent hydrolase